MQLSATFNLNDLTPSETAEFELRCREAGISPDAKIEQLIKADNKRNRPKKPKQAKSAA